LIYGLRQPTTVASTSLPVLALCQPFSRQ
jgi:hypothetical protein